MPYKWNTQVAWICKVCPGDPQFDHPAMVSHLKTEHNIDTKTTKGTREGVSFMDGSGFYQNTYRWKFGELELIQSIRGDRVKVK